MIKDPAFASPKHEMEAPTISYSQAMEIIKELSGKVFTQLDACITNDRQLKSIKDCIRNDIAYSYSQLYEITDPEMAKHIPVAGVDFDEKDLKEVSLEEAVGV